MVGRVTAFLYGTFGLRQVYLQLTGRPYTALPFGTPGLYRYVRHPIYLSWLCIFWAMPQMTIAHWCSRSRRLLTC